MSEFSSWPWWSFLVIGLSLGRWFSQRRAVHRAESRATARAESRVSVVQELHHDASERRWEFGGDEDHRSLHYGGSAHSPGELLDRTEILGMRELPPVRPGRLVGPGNEPGERVLYRGRMSRPGREYDGDAVGGRHPDELVRHPSSAVFHGRDVGGVVRAHSEAGEVLGRVRGEPVKRAGIGGGVGSSFRGVAGLVGGGGLPGRLAGQSSSTGEGVRGMATDYDDDDWEWEDEDIDEEDEYEASDSVTSIPPQAATSRRVGRRAG